MSYLTGDPLAVRIRIAFGASIAADPATWAWTDVTAWWHASDDVTIVWGRSSGAEQPERSTLSLTLKNTDGRFTSYDPRSPYWPNVRQWTPIQYDIDLGDGAGWRNRFSGSIRKWPLTWPGASALMALARIEAVGVLGRVARGKPPARSAMRRTIAASGPVAYWPLEDGSAAGQGASALSDVGALSIAGASQFVAIGDTVYGKQITIRYGTSALLDLSGGAIVSAKVPGGVTAATSAAWTVSVAAAVDYSTASGDVVVLDVATPGGTFVRWQLIIRKATLHTQVVALDAAGAATTVIDDGGVLTTLAQYNFSVWQSGGTINVGYFWGGASYSLTGSVAGTLRGLTAVSLNPTGATATVQMPFGHLAVWAAQHTPIAESFTDSYGVFVVGSTSSWRGEAAVDRMARLCAEEGIPLQVTAPPAEFVSRMGWQASGTFTDLIGQCEAVDQGLIYEAGFGLGYLPRASRYNASVALTIDAAAGQLGMPFEPVDDDQQLRNRWTVERVDGSSAVAVDPASVDSQGEIEGSATVNLAGDAELPDQAGWRLHLSTVQEPRYPAVSIDLSVHPELAAAWSVCKPGSRVQVVNPPVQNVPGVVDQLVVGATETYRGRTSWKATLNVVPASPWQVATVGGPQRVAGDGSTLASGVSSSAMTLSIATPTLPALWTTDPADFPVDLRVGGEQVRVSAISGISSPQTATVSARAVNGVARAWPAGTEVDVWQPAVVAL